jgi:glutaredoxin-dependent peroxiredoxin
LPTSSEKSEHTFGRKTEANFFNAKSAKEITTQRSQREETQRTQRKTLPLQKIKIMSIQVLQQAPTFSLFDSAMKPVSLADFAGNKNVLLLFFPMAFTGVCTAELCGVRDDIAKYNNANAEVLGISVDSVFTLAKFKEDQGYNFTLLSDFNKEVSNAYGSIYESFTGMAMKGVSKRSAFVIDKAGVVQYAEVLESAGDVPNFEAINDVLAKLA